MAPSWPLLLVAAFAAPDADWPPADGLDTLGNHRVALTVPPDAADVGAVEVTIDWRWCPLTRDANGSCPIALAVLPDGAQGFGQFAPVKSCSRVASNETSFTLVFSPDAGPGDYFVYTMPFRLYDGYGQGPSVTYYDHGGGGYADLCSDDRGWWARAFALASPDAEATQAVSARDAFSPEERAATDARSSSVRFTKSKASASLAGGRRCICS